ncbi:MAG: RluA family pseudouridine synthase [Clostridiales bacterium]|jgi:23S rRNA pseudouridine1911/1915/1917 synthase|nr:RluA family pseudouridine synthase [Clostridiales bacterium]
MIDAPVSAAAAGRRFDVCAAELFGITRNAAQNLIEGGHLFLNGRPAPKNTRVKVGDICRMEVVEPALSEIRAEDIPLDVLYEDSELIVVNKPRGMVVHPAPGHYGGTLVNALLFHCGPGAGRGSGLSGINGILRPGIVHRIDKDTSGVLVAAKTDRAHASLAAQLEAHSMARVYHAIAHGVIHQDFVSVNRPIGRSPADRKKMAVTDKNSKPAVTHIHVLERFRRFCHVQVNLETGRTHQIRVHMSYTGHPLLGDEVYGRASHGVAGGQILHARRLGFIHPVSGDRLIFETELPSYFNDALEYARRQQ